MELETKYFSGIYQLRCEQAIDASLAEVWEFFSSPKNLDKITPDDMGFEITSTLVEDTYEGQIITYDIEILPKIKSAWVTEITHYKEREFFVDEQRFGPYKMWHHEHHFKALSENRVLMTDIVSYKLPLGFLGKLVAGRMIQTKVQSIFQHRKKVIEELFN